MRSSLVACWSHLLDMEGGDDGLHFTVCLRNLVVLAATGPFVDHCNFGTFTSSCVVR
jgi:hypothetical protein